MRDAAYQMQMPGDRAKLHELAVYLIEAATGGRPPIPAPLDSVDPPKLAAHILDSVAENLAEHALKAGDGEAADKAQMHAVRKLYLHRAAEYYETTFQRRASARTWQQLALLLEGVARAEALRRAASMLTLAGQTGDAELLLQSALECLQEAGSPRFEGFVLRDLAVVQRDVGSSELSQATFDKALTAHRQAGNRRGEGTTLANLGFLCANTGLIEQAESAYEAALTIHREVGNRNGECVALGSLASLCRKTGRIEKASELAAQSLAIALETGDRTLEGWSRSEMGILQWELGKLQLVEESFTQALQIMREIGNRVHEGVIRGNLANLCMATDRFEQAEREYEYSLAIHRENGSQRSEGLTLGNLAILYRETGRLAEADQVFKQALAIHQAVKNPWFEGIHLCELARNQLLGKHENDARVSWQAGASILGTVGDKRELERQTAAMREACAKAGIEPFEILEGDAIDERQ